MTSQQCKASNCGEDSGSEGGSSPGGTAWPTLGGAIWPTIPGAYWPAVLAHYRVNSDSGRPARRIAQSKARAVPGRMPGTHLVRGAFGRTIEGAIAGHAHDGHQIGVLTMGVQVGRLAILTVGHLETQLVVKG